MDKGKVEYAPDYESNKFSDFFNEQMKNPAFKEAYLKVDAEENAKLAKALSREWKVRELEREVVEAAKKWRKAGLQHSTHITAIMCPICAAERVFWAGVDALEKFEAEHKTNGS